MDPMNYTFGGSAASPLDTGELCFGFLDACLDVSTCSSFFATKHVFKRL